MDAHAEAFLLLARPMLGRLHRVAVQYARREADARDLAQETLLRAWRSYSPGGERAYQAGWLFSILRNVALEWRRSEAARIRIELVPDGELTELAAPDLGEPFGQFPPLAEAEFLELLDERLVEALNALEGPSREVLVLSVAGGLTYREIAQALDCPIGTVMSRVARARHALRERLAGAAWSAKRRKALRR